MTSNKLIKFNLKDINTSHSALLLVSLENIKKNYKFLKKKVNNSDLGISIKANAYGLGLKEVCCSLLKLGCKTFFVATPKEALETIKIAKNADVYLLNGVNEKSIALTLIKKGIKIVINSKDQLEKLINISIEKNLKPACALHIDTGMNRLGIEMESIEEINSLAKNHLNIMLIMSHLSCSENKLSKINNYQLKRFKSIKNNFKENKKLKFSLANSYGILLNKKFHFNLCRPGGLIYGLTLNNRSVKGINAVTRLLAKVLQVKRITKGDYVGYGAKFKADKKLVIATIGIGYSDGLPRSFSGSAYYKNFKFPIIGSISMDLCTIDISQYKNLKVNDWVEIFGQSNSIEDFASKCDTITYEITSKIGSRVKRIYL